MTVRHFAPRFQAIDLSGKPAPGAKLRFYDATTTTPRAVYSDSGLTTAITQPVVADSDAMFEQIYLQSGAYKTTLHSSADVLLRTDDNLDPGLSTSAGALAIAGGGTGATTASGARSNLGAYAQTAGDALDARVDATETLLDNPILSVASAQTYASSFTPVVTADQVRSVTLTGNITINAATATAGQYFTLVIIQDATGGRTWTVNSAYKFPGAYVPPLSTSANAVDVLHCYARTSSIFEVLSFKRQDYTPITWFKETNLGTLAVATQFTTAHGLGRYPSLIMVFLENTSTDAGYAVGDRIVFPTAGHSDTGDGTGTGYGATSSMSTTDAQLVTGVTAIHIKNKTTGAHTALTVSKWSVIMRVYA